MEITKLSDEELDAELKRRQSVRNARAAGERCGDAIAQHGYYRHAAIEAMIGTFEPSTVAMVRDVLAKRSAP